MINGDVKVGMVYKTVDEGSMHDHVFVVKKFISGKKTFVMFVDIPYNDEQDQMATTEETFRLRYELIN